MECWLNPRCWANAPEKMTRAPGRARWDVSYRTSLHPVSEVPLEALTCERCDLWNQAHVVQRRLDGHVPHKQSELRQRGLDIPLCPVHANQRLDCKSLAQIVNSWSAAFRIAHIGEVEESFEKRPHARRAIAV